MKISVIVPVYNEEKYIFRLLEGFVNQKEKPEEIIIIDNNCTDKTIKIVQTFKKKLPLKIVKERKQGIIFARNKGFNEARGDILARCDADTVVPPNWIAKIKDNFSNKRIAALTGPAYFYDLPLKLLVAVKIYLKIFYHLQNKKNILIGPNLALTKKAWCLIKDNVCLNDKKVHEDIDLAIHLNKKKLKIFVDDRLTVGISARRIKKNPFSFFIEYPWRAIKTVAYHL